MDAPANTLHIERRVRPLRIGFVVDVEDGQQARRAMEIATSQWGGLLFPLLPNFQRRPRWWRSTFLPGPSASAIRDGLRRAFFPDFEVDLDQPDRDASRVTKVTLHQLTERSEWSDIEAGLPADAVYRDLWENDPRFLQREGAAAVVPRPPDGNEELELFLAACFGGFAEAGDLATLQASYRQLFEAEDLTMTPERLLEGFRPTAKQRFLTPLAIASYGLRLYGDPAVGGIKLMLLDPTRVSDVVDFWNLRALDVSVVPVPLPWLEDLLPLLLERLPRAGGDRWESHVDVAHAQRVADELRDGVVARLREAGIHAWAAHYPDFSRAGRDYSTWRMTAVADEDTVEVAVRGGRVRVGLLAPRAAAYCPPGINRWMGTVEISGWSLPRDGWIAGLLPTALGQVSHRLGAYTHLDVRASREGLQVPSGTREDALDWRPPSGTEVLAALLERDHQEVRLSPPGRIAAELIRRLGGLDAVGLVQHEPLVKLLDDIASSQLELSDEPPLRRRRYAAEVPRPKLLAELRRIHGNEGLRAARHLAVLVERGVLTSGARLECPACTQHNWYPVDSLAQQMRCERCLRQFPFPHANPPSADEWAYRTLGAFAFRDLAAGAYTVAFSLKFLSAGTFERTSWSPNLQLDPDTEVDFAVMRQSRGRLTAHEEPELLLGEAKSYGRFTDRDFARAARLRRRFPEAILVFATLRRRIEREEVSALRALARPTTRRPADVPWKPRVMVLTGLELFHRGGAPDCWREAGGHAGEVAAANRVISNDPEVVQLADLTLQIHLRVQPHHLWAQRQVETLRPSAQRKASRRTRKGAAP